MVSPAQFLISAFGRRYGKTPEVFRAPGRVNLIGEHTDYNLGYVLPMAVDLACYAASVPNNDGVLRLYSLNLEEAHEWPLAQLPSIRPSRHWTDYVIGVVRQLDLGCGADLMLYGTVPFGSGLSSSASLEVSVALASGWRGSSESGVELARLCQRAENDFVGLPSGIMDQYVSVFGEANAAVQIDCRSLSHETVELPKDASFVAVNSMVKHELAGKSAYRERVAECARAVEAIQRRHPEVKSLRDAVPRQLNEIEDPVALKRARHIIGENTRVLDFAAAARAADLTTMGRLLLASHNSLRDDYEVSCEELDFLVDAAGKIEGVRGARMTGGGFGGCTVNLLEAGAESLFETEIRRAYAQRFGIEATVYRVHPAQGASRIS